MAETPPARAHLERMLLVCGDPDSGKSTLIRHMFKDHRLGGIVAPKGRLPSRMLSQERCLAGRSMSPHEANETPADFHGKIERLCLEPLLFSRINYVSAIQPRPHKRMPGIVDVCEGLRAKFKPERIRIIQLAPDQKGRQTSQLSEAEIDGLRELHVEIMTIDARRSDQSVYPGNVRLLADFFDFS